MRGEVPSPVQNTDHQKTNGAGVVNFLRGAPRQVLFDAARAFFDDILKTPAIAARRSKLRARGRRAIAYIGWTGHRNLGDEAVFEAIRRSLALNDALIPWIQASGEATFARWGLGGTSIFRAAVLGGGTLINPDYLPAARLVRKGGIPLYTLGTGVGSPGFFAPAQVSLRGWKEVLQGCRLVSVRGPLSGKLLRELDVCNAEVIGDPALAFAPQTPPTYRSRQRLVINLSHERLPTSGTSEYAFLTRIARLANSFASGGGELVGVALGARDRQAMERFARDHSVSKLRITNHRISPQALLHTISGSVGLIGVRLHSAVLASCVGVPSILLAYRDKCRDFMESMEMSEFVVDLSKGCRPGQIEECFERLQFQSELGEKIYGKAIYWKNKQLEFYSRVAKDILSL